MRLYGLNLALSCSAALLVPIVLEGPAFISDALRPSKIASAPLTPSDEESCTTVSAALFSCSLVCASILISFEDSCLATFSLLYPRGCSSLVSVKRSNLFSLPVGAMELISLNLGARRCCYLLYNSISGCGSKEVIDIKRNSPGDYRGCIKEIWLCETVDSCSSCGSVEVYLDLTESCPEGALEGVNLNPV